MLTTLLERLTGRMPSKRKAEVFYGKVVAAARQPGFYGSERVPDTPEGRFEMVALHLFLVAERIKMIAPDGQDIARGLIEAFVADMDDCMREMGVGDLTVPKRVKRAAAGFYERAGEYRDALGGSATNTDSLASFVMRTILPPHGDQNFAGALADYIRASHSGLNRLSDADMANGQLEFATPPDVLAGTADGAI